MKVEVDQSWKIERTNKDTIIAFSDRKKASVRLKAKIKRAAFVYLEEKFGRTKLNILRIFAAGTVLLLARATLKGELELVIDQEYPGHEEEIKSMLVEFGRKLNLSLKRDMISFSLIGKDSGAHFLSYGVYIGKQKATFEPTFRELLEILP